MAKRRKLKSAGVVPARHQGPHDRRAMQLPAHKDLAAVEIIDPYALGDPPAQNARGEWETPDPPRLLVIQSYRQDPLGQMYARDNIKSAEYAAARYYQRLHDEVQVGLIKAVDPANEYVDGGSLPDMLTDRRKQATDRIRSVDHAISRQHGAIGLSVMRGVLIDRRTLADMAGPELPIRRYFAGLFHDCLYTLGQQMGTIRAAVA